jgi:hypothetical protein
LRKTCLKTRGKQIRRTETPAATGSELIEQIADQVRGGDEAHQLLAVADDRE